MMEAGNMMEMAKGMRIVTETAMVMVMVMEMAMITGDGDKAL